MPALGRTSILGAAWRLIAPLLRAPDRAASLALLGAVAGLYLAMTGLDVLLNGWSGAIFDALQQRDGSGFIALLFGGRRSATGFMPGWLAIMLPYIAMTISSTYLLQWLQIRWRRRMTGHMLDGFLADHAYYRIGLGAELDADNPDQRLADDIASFCTATPSLLLDLFANLVSLLSFVVVLWHLSGVVRIAGLGIPGVLVWAALAYAVVGTSGAHLVGRPLIQLDYLRERFEADFRFALMRLRAAAERVALAGGAATERTWLEERFGTIVGNWFALMRRRAGLAMFALPYARLQGLIPIVLSAPRFFAGTMSFGDITRTAGAFAQVQASLSWFVSAYAQLAAWAATVRRLDDFERAVLRARAGSTIARVAGGREIAAFELRVDLPDGRVLLGPQSFRWAPGETILLQGPVGSGKSTLLRALAGLWPFGAGSVAVPSGRLLFVGPRAYLPAGQLRAALGGTACDQTMSTLLQQIGLTGFGERLDETADWPAILSAGQLQLLAMARAVLAAPDWLVLDEATEHLDAATESMLDAVVRSRLPDVTIIAVRHRVGTGDAMRVVGIDRLDADTWEQGQGSARHPLGADPHSLGDTR